MDVAMAPAIAASVGDDKAASEAPGEIAPGPSQTDITHARSDITELNIFRNTYVDHPRVRLINGITGNLICLPGAGTKENLWTLPGKFTVGDVVNTPCICIYNDSYVLEPDGTKKIVQVAGVLYRGAYIANNDIPLASCTDDRGNVTVICGKSPLSPSEPYEDKPCVDVSELGTPPTPPPTLR